jgi:WD40 repeat protein
MLRLVNSQTMRRSITMVFVGAMAVCVSAMAQGTKLWTTSSYDQMERGTTEGVAIRSTGRLEPGPSTSLLYESAGNYVWSVAADAAGNAYVALGGTAANSAAVMKVSAEGKATKVFEGKELGVQALRLGTDGHVYAATSPDGKIYRLGKTAADAEIVFDPATTAEKPKYLWDVVQAPGAGKPGDLYVAAGAPAVVYRVPADGGKAEIAFKTADQHIRCLLLSPDGTLWAGSDGSGVIYKLDTKTPDARPIAAYDSAKVEITALARDDKGNIYAAGVGTRPAPGASRPGLPPLPVTGSVGVTISFSQAGSANAAAQNTLIPEGSEIDRIAPDGSPQRLLSLKDDVVYALAWHKDALLAATGNRGRVYRINTLVDTSALGEFTDVAHLNAGQGMAFADTPSALLVATSNSGKVFRLDDKPAANATYTSQVEDAGAFSKWGRIEVLPEPTSAVGATASFDVFVRTGNVQNPLSGWSDWLPVTRDGSVTVPGGRYAQWKTVLRAGAEVQSVGLNYLQKNLAPMVDQIVVEEDARVTANAAAANTTVQIKFPSAASSTSSFQPETNTEPLTAQKERGAITARWAAHDDNGDDMMYSVWYRGVGEQNWRLLKDKLSEKYLSFDSSLLPDGSYELKVVASDAPDHTDADTLSGERASDAFVVDTTPPVPGALSASLVAGRIHATFDAKDAASPIAHAEYSVDAGPWQYLEPVGSVSDSKEERYDFMAAIPPVTGEAAAGVTASGEHVIAVRVYDRYENLATAKAVVR